VCVTPHLHCIHEVPASAVPQVEASNRHQDPLKTHITDHQAPPRVSLSGHEAELKFSSLPLKGGCRQEQVGCAEARNCQQLVLPTAALPPSRCRRRLRGQQAPQSMQADHAPSSSAAHKRAGSWLLTDLDLDAYRTSKRFKTQVGAGLFWGTVRRCALAAGLPGACDTPCLPP
jgi:hypothetical protein